MGKKLVSLGLIAVAMFVNPAMAAWYDKNGAAIHPSRVVHCIRAPDTGSLPEVRGIVLPANRQPAPGRRGATKAAQPSLPPASFTASGLQTLASLPEVRGIVLLANRQPGAKTQVNAKKRVWTGEKPGLSGAA